MSYSPVRKMPQGVDMKFFRIEDKIYKKNIILLGVIKFSYRPRGKIEDFYINKFLTACKIFFFKDCGVNREMRPQRLIVSLTSYPPKIKDTVYAVYSLLRQSLKPDEVVLWLAEEQFPNREKDLPRRLLALRRNGLSIRWCRDLKSYKKLVPALREYPDALIATADDDIFYDRDWLKILYEQERKTPQYLNCHRAHQITFDGDKINTYGAWNWNVSSGEASFLNFCTSGAGVLWSRNKLDPRVTDEAAFFELCPYADDIWFWSMAVLAGKRIKVAENNISRLLMINPRKKRFKFPSLGSKNIGENMNDAQLAAVCRAFPEVWARLREEAEQ